MHLIHQADNLFEAYLVKHALEDAGIPAFVLGESLLGGMGELPLFGVLRVCVPDAAREQAEDVVAALELGAAASPLDEDEDDEAPGLLPA